MSVQFLKTIGNIFREKSRKRPVVFLAVERLEDRTLLAGDIGLQLDILQSPELDQAEYSEFNPCQCNLQTANITNSNLAFEGPKIWLADENAPNSTSPGANKANPNLSQDILGIKFEFGDNDTVVSFQSDFAPVEGFFYAKDGVDNNQGVKTVVYAEGIVLVPGESGDVNFQTKTGTSSTADNTIIGSGSWSGAQSGFEVSWEIVYENGVWNYTYTFSGEGGEELGKDISHVIISTPCDEKPPQDPPVEPPEVEPPPEVCEEGITAYQLYNHPDGNARQPEYGLRLDELYDATEGHDIFTFDFNHEDSDIKLYYDENQNIIIIHGVVFGGLDTGDEYDSGFSGLWEVHFVYNMNVSEIDDNGLSVSDENISNTGFIHPLFDQSLDAVFLTDESGNFDHSFKFDDDQHRLPNNSEIHVGRGWLNYIVDGEVQNHIKSSDWIFTAEAIVCELPPVDPPPVDPPPVDPPPVDPPKEDSKPPEPWEGLNAEFFDKDEFFERYEAIFKEKEIYLSTHLYPWVEIGDATVEEGNNGETKFLVFEVKLKGRTDKEITVGYKTNAGTAHPKQDYQEQSGTVTLSNTNRTALIKIPVHGDDIEEEKVEKMEVQLFEPIGAKLAKDKGVGTIIDNDGKNKQPPENKE